MIQNLIFLQHQKYSFQDRKIELVDDHYGIIVACKKERKRYDFPLVDLIVTEKK